MSRFLLAVTVLSCILTPLVPAADVAEDPSSSQPAPAKAGPIYVKILWPVDPAAPVIENDHRVIESWIVKSIENRHKANFRAVTAWVPLVEEPFEHTHLWDGTLDGKSGVCVVFAGITERKDGWIKITIHGGTPVGGTTTVTLKDEPGSREVAPITQAETAKREMPHVAVFIGLPQEKRK